MAKYDEMLPAVCITALIVARDLVYVPELVEKAISTHKTKILCLQTYIT